MANESNLFLIISVGTVVFALVVRLGVELYKKSL